MQLLYPLSTPPTRRRSITHSLQSRRFFILRSSTRTHPPVFRRPRRLYRRNSYLPKLPHYSRVMQRGKRSHRNSWCPGSDPPPRWWSRLSHRYTLDQTVLFRSRQGCIRPGEDSWRSRWFCPRILRREVARRGGELVACLALMGWLVLLVVDAYSRSGTVQCLSTWGFFLFPLKEKKDGEFCHRSRQFAHLVCLKFSLAQNWTLRDIGSCQVCFQLYLHSMYRCYLLWPSSPTNYYSPEDASTYA